MRSVYGGNDGSAYVEYDAVLSETVSANLNGELVVIPQWLAEAKRIVSDW